MTDANKGSGDRSSAAGSVKDAAAPAMAEPKGKASKGKTAKDEASGPNEAKQAPSNGSAVNGSAATGAATTGTATTGQLRVLVSRASPLPRPGDRPGRRRVHAVPAVLRA